jgi:RNA-directed DNA polymerase
MQIEDATTQTSAPRPELSERISRKAGLGAEIGTAADGQTKAEGLWQMEAVVERSNLWRAYERVMRNKGAAGVDGLSVHEFKSWLQQHWPSVKAALLAGDYLPAAIRKVDIPKPNGGVRTLGIPTVVDRLIQQALLQVLQPEFEPEFSEHMAAMEAAGHPQQATASTRSG